MLDREKKVCDAKRDNDSLAFVLVLTTMNTTQTTVIATTALITMLYLGRKAGRKAGTNLAAASLPGSASVSTAASSKVASSSQYPRYVSTRGKDVKNFREAVLLGLASDGGLFVPDFVPTVSSEELKSWKDLSFAELAEKIMTKYIDPEAMTREELKTLTARSFAHAPNKFRHERITPTISPSKLSPVSILELFHGPTFAFKDVALQYLGNLFELFLSKEAGKKITVLGATSGDTGSSAIYGLRGKTGVDCFILFPEGKVSQVQERQMTTVMDANVQCLAVRGTFDDAQDIVKAAFKHEEFRAKHSLAAVNSINWARILAQITYYFYSYFDLQRAGKISSNPGGRGVEFVVPTGNFGDILAGYYARRMGLPIRRLVVATNENDILHRFFETGTYSRREMIQTITPSMDICVSSNFERFIYHALNDDPKALSALMSEFDQKKAFTLPPAALERCRDVMSSGRATEEEIRTTMRSVAEEAGYVLDPHSAVGVCVAKAMLAKGKTTSSTEVVCLATAHWAKFLDSVEPALGEKNKKMISKENFPKELRFEGMPTKKIVIDATLAEVERVIEEKKKGR